MIIALSVLLLEFAGVQLWYPSWFVTVFLLGRSCFTWSCVLVACFGACLAVSVSCPPIFCARCVFSALPLLSPSRSLTCLSVSACYLSPSRLVFVLFLCFSCVACSFWWFFRSGRKRTVCSQFLCFPCLRRSCSPLSFLLACLFFSFRSSVVCLVVLVFCGLRLPCSRSVRVRLVFLLYKSHVSWAPLVYMSLPSCHAPPLTIGVPLNPDSLSLLCVLCELALSN